MRLTLAQRRALWAYLALSVPLLFFLFLRLGPAGYALHVGFFEWDILSPNRPFVGLDNYRKLFADPVFRQSLWNTIVYVVVGVPAQLIVGIGVALLIQRANRFAGLFRMIYFIPFVTSTVAVAWVWRWMLMKNTGVINQILGFFGIPDQPFLGSPSQAIYMIIAAAVWQGLGFQMVIFLAGLEAIPEQFYEAARIDGATPWRLFRHITLPLLNPTIVFSAIIGSIRYLQLFTEVLNMSDQGRGGPLNSTKSLVLFIYQEAFQRFHMGYASAATVVLFALILAMTVLQMRVIRKEVSY